MVEVPSQPQTRDVGSLRVSAVLMFHELRLFIIYCFLVRDGNNMLGKE